MSGYENARRVCAGQVKERDADTVPVAMSHIAGPPYRRQTADAAPMARCTSYNDEHAPVNDVEFEEDRPWWR